MKEYKLDEEETDQTAFSAEVIGDDYRLINSDGTFNIKRIGSSGTNVYEKVLENSWTAIIAGFLFFYFAINSVFALIFICIGVENIRGATTGSFFDEFTQMIYFSFQTFTTVGYGYMSPSGQEANLFAAFVAFIGLISFAILTGLSFAKFSKPKAHIQFSDKMLIAPNPKRNNSPSLQFRIVNQTNNQIIDLEARVTLAWLENIDGIMRRRFERLDLEIELIHLFPLNWTIVHHINEDSPLFGKTLENFIQNKMEILVLIKGFDDTYSQMVHSKRSYSCCDLIEGAKFVTMYENTEDKTILRLSKLNEYEPYVFN